MYTDFDVDGIDVRRVASEWHSGQWSDLYAFTSTGHIASTLDTEVERCLKALNADPALYADADTGQDPDTLREELGALLTYVTQPITSVWSQHGHDFHDSDGYATCWRCGGEWELVRDRGDDPTHGAYQASNGDEPTECHRVRGHEHGDPRETGLDCPEGCAHECNCVACA